MTLTAGTRLGTYEILGLLGAGGMGEVYRARDLRLGREIAIKVLPAEVASSPDSLSRFEREARTVGGLNHPNIVVLHTVEDADGFRFLTMELVEGQTLSTLVSPGGLPLPKLLELAIPLTDALVAAHEKGVIHRDLKPGNVMVTREGRVKVLDFGLAKMMGPTAPVAQGASFTVTADGPISGEGRVMGTVPYMAPEQLRGEAPDARADLFSLGIILYELATGRRPFGGETSIDVSHAILRETPEPMSRMRTDLPGDFTTLVDHCLEKSPRERVQTALDVNNALRRLRKVLERGEPEKPASGKVASIAVLPFVNRSASADDEYFSDGLADELLNVLSKIKGLRVTARSSAFHFKGKGTPAAEIGSALNVATLLEGSVRKAGNRIRVSVQLVQVSDSSHLWSETYDRTLEDIFAVQDDIAQSVVKELRTTLLGEAVDSDASGAAKAEVAQAAKGRGTDPEAYRLYLQARYFLDRHNRESVANGIGYLEKALELDPNLALAWADLGRAYLIEVDTFGVPAGDGYGRARKAVLRALSLEPDLAEAHAVMGRLQLQSRDFEGGERSLRHALALARGQCLALRWAAGAAVALGRLDEAIETLRQMIDQDPLNAAVYSNLGLNLHHQGHLTEAEAAFRKALELTPERSITRYLLAVALADRERCDEALEQATREPEEGFRLLALALVHYAAGRRLDSDRALQELIHKYGGTMAYYIAGTYARRGETERAFEWLQQAYDQESPTLWEMRTDYFFRSLHADPRWGAFLRKMGLEH